MGSTTVHIVKNLDGVFTKNRKALDVVFVLDRDHEVSGMTASEMEAGDASRESFNSRWQ